MKYHISIHISPYEIDNYQTFIHQLRRNLNYIDDEIIFSPYLNLSTYFYDWRNSKLKSDFFVNRFNELNNIIKDECELDSTVNFKDKILGAFSYKTMFLEQYQDKVDAFIWFDSDMIFPDNAIVSLIGAHKALEDKHCIITPQIHRLWDETWDVLVNEDYIIYQHHMIIILGSMVINYLKIKKEIYQLLKMNKILNLLLVGVTY